MGKYPTTGFVGSHCIIFVNHILSETLAKNAKKEVIDNNNKERNTEQHA